MKARILLCMVAFTLCSCAQQEAQWSELTLMDLQNQSVALKQWQNKYVVFMFLSPECPLCQSYSLQINKLQKKFENDSTQFVGIVAGKFYPVQQIKHFIVKHDMRLPVLLDSDFKLANTINATITPEVFVTIPGGEVVYSGAIDDWAIDLGRKKLKPEVHYLNNALISLRQKSKISPIKTKAIGCFIE